MTELTPINVEDYGTEGNPIVIDPPAPPVLSAFDSYKKYSFFKNSPYKIVVSGIYDSFDTFDQLKTYMGGQLNCVLKRLSCATILIYIGIAVRKDVPNALDIFHYVLSKFEPVENSLHNEDDDDHYISNFLILTKFY